MIGVSGRIECYELNGDRCRLPDEMHITVDSHWNRDNLVVLNVNGTKVTVVARDLQAAVANATNSGGR